MLQLPKYSWEHVLCVAVTAAEEDLCLNYQNFHHQSKAVLFYFV